MRLKLIAINSDFRSSGTAHIAFHERRYDNAFIECFRSRSLNIASTVIERIQHHHLFNALTEEDLHRLMSISSKKSVDAEETLFIQGDQASCFFYVLEGRFRLYRMAPSGHEKLFDVVSGGQCFAEALMFSDALKYPVTASALEPSQIIAIPCKDYKKLLSASPELCFSLMTQMSRRLHVQLNEIENLSLQNALHRFVNYLLRKFEARETEWVLDMPKKLIASQLAIQPETLSRLLRRLTDEKIIEVRKKQIVLLDKNALLDRVSDNQPLRAMD